MKVAPLPSVRLGVVPFMAMAEMVSSNESTLVAPLRFTGPTEQLLARTNVPDVTVNGEFSNWPQTWIEPPASFVAPV